MRSAPNVLSKWRTGAGEASEELVRDILAQGKWGFEGGQNLVPRTRSLMGAEGGSISRQFLSRGPYYGN